MSLGQTLTLTCPSCGKDSQAGFQLDPAFKTGTLRNNAETCPHRKTASTFNKQDYSFKYVSHRGAPRRRRTTSWPSTARRRGREPSRRRR